MGQEPVMRVRTRAAWTAGVVGVAEPARAAVRGCGPGRPGSRRPPPKPPPASGAGSRRGEPCSRCARARIGSTPSETRPVSGRRSPARQASRVDLPAPLGPTMAVTSPGRNRAPTPASTAWPPRETVRFFGDEVAHASSGPASFTRASGASRSAGPGRTARPQRRRPRPGGPRRPRASGRTGMSAASTMTRAGHGAGARRALG